MWLKIYQDKEGNYYELNMSSSYNIENGILFGYLRSNGTYEYPYMGFLWMSKEQIDAMIFNAKFDSLLKE